MPSHLKSTSRLASSQTYIFISLGQLLRTVLSTILIQQEPFPWCCFCPLSQAQILVYRNVQEVYEVVHEDKNRLLLLLHSRLLLINTQW